MTCLSPDVHRVVTVNTRRSSVIMSSWLWQWAYETKDEPHNRRVDSDKRMVASESGPQLEVLNHLNHRLVHT